MGEPSDYSFRRYLQAKRTVDTRARNGRVLDVFRTMLARIESPIRVCEIGAGTGSVLAQFPTWIGSDQSVTYTAIETDPTVFETAIEIGAEWTDDPPPSLDADGRTTIDCTSVPMTIDYLLADGLGHLDDHQGHYDVVIAQSFMDLVDVEAAIERVLEGLRSGGLAYFPLTFDGTTGLVPTIDPSLDARIERRYHHHMETTVKAAGYTGDSRAGRHLLTAPEGPSRTVEAAGGSDWIVTPEDEGYPADEAYFLHYIVDTIATALADDDLIDSDRLAAWEQCRHEQISAGDLVYLTHQLDVLLRRTDRS